MRHVVGVTKTTVAAKLLCRVCAALLDGLCLASPISPVSNILAWGLHLPSYNQDLIPIFIEGFQVVRGKFCNFSVEAHLAAYEALLVLAMSMVDSSQDTAFALQIRTSKVSEV